MSTLIILSLSLFVGYLMTREGWADGRKDWRYLLGSIVYIISLFVGAFITTIS